MAKLARGNDRLMFAISTAFAAPLSSRSAWKAAASICAAARRRKMTILRAAGTVWGGGGQYGYIRTWRATDNALEAVAAAHNNAFLALDEIAEIEPKALFRAAYALANGRQKERMGKSIDLRAGNTWRLLFMSTGEIGMADKLSEDRMRATGGQTVRLVEIRSTQAKDAAPSDAHGSRDEAVRRRLTAAGLKQLGHAAPLEAHHEEAHRRGDEGVPPLSIKLSQRRRRTGSRVQPLRDRRAGELAIAEDRGERGAETAEGFSRMGEGARNEGDRGGKRRAS